MSGPIHRYYIVAVKTTFCRSRWLFLFADLHCIQHFYTMCINCVHAILCWCRGKNGASKNSTKQVYLMNARWTLDKTK